MDEGGLVASDARDPPVDKVMAGAYEFVATTPCDLVLVQADDLAGMRVGVNLPGTDAERPNWRLRLPPSIETLLRGNVAQAILNSVRATGRATPEQREDPDE
jgi:glycogen operon protein